MKAIDILLDSCIDKTVGNYSIKFTETRKAAIIHYDTIIAMVNFGDNFGSGAKFRLMAGDGSISTTKAKNYIQTKLLFAGFKQV